MDGVDFEKALDLILERDGRYHREAYLFMRDALDATQKGLRPEVSGERAEVGIKHVSGQELLEGIRVYGLEVYGPMALWVFNEWGVRGCEDFGEIVFNLIEGGLFAKREGDSRDDFRGGYVFEEAFRKPFLPNAERERLGTARGDARPTGSAREGESEERETGKAGSRSGESREVGSDPV